MTKQLPSHSCALCAIQSDYDDDETSLLHCRVFVVGCLCEMKSHLMLLFAIDVNKLITLKRRIVPSQTYTKTEANRVNGSNVHLGISGHRNRFSF